MMRCEVKLVRPDDQEATVSITMPIKHWQRLQEKLEEGLPSASKGTWPTWCFLSALQKVLSEGKSFFRVEHEFGVDGD